MPTSTYEDEILEYQQVLMAFAEDIMAWIRLPLQHPDKRPRDMLEKYAIMLWNKDHAPTESEVRPSDEPVF